MLSGKSIALLLWGDAFRSKNHSTTKCHINSIDSQFSASASQILNIVEPLEEYGSKVHIIFTFPFCTDENMTSILLKRITSWIGSRTIASRKVHTRNLFEAVRAAWQLLVFHMSKFKIHYDYVLQLRHDIFQEYPIHKWPSTTIITPHAGHTLRDSNFGNMTMHSTFGKKVDYDKVLFEAPCPQCENSCNCGHNEALHPTCKICTNDHMIWVPGAFIYDVAAASNTPKLSGHLFYRKVSKRVPDEQIGFIYPPQCTHQFCNDIIQNQYRSYRPRRPLF